MSFNENVPTKYLFLSLAVSIFMTGFALLGTLNDEAYFKQVLPYVGGLFVLWLVIGLSNQYLIKSGYLTFFVWVINPMLWGIMGSGAIWYIRLLGIDWMWWGLYPGLYFVSYLPQIVFPKWWQVHDDLVIKISLWCMMIPSVLFGGKYARYKFRFMELRGTMPRYGSLKLSDWAMIVVSTMVGFWFINCIWAWTMAEYPEF